MTTASYPSGMSDAEIIHWLWRRVDALERLNTSYRTGGRLPDKTLDELDRARKALAGVPRPGRWRSA